MRYRAAIALGATALALLALPACSSGGGGESGSASTVEMTEYKFAPTPDTAKAGKVTIKAKNAGTMDHELVVLAVADPTSLPTKPDGSVDEDRIPANQKVGEVGDVKAGATVSKTLELGPGTYSFICNKVDTNPDGTTTSHFKQGMYTTFVVQ